MSREMLLVFVPVKYVFYLFIHLSPRHLGAFIRSVSRARVTASAGRGSGRGRGSDRYRQEIHNNQVTRP